MHFFFVLLMLGVVVILRWSWRPSLAPWSQRWLQTLICFTLPPLLLVMSAIAVVWMGPQGEMMGLPTDPLSYSVIVGFLVLGLGMTLQQVWTGYQSLQTLSTYPIITLNLPSGYQKSARLLAYDGLFCAQVGFWQPELVVSQGLLDTLKGEHLTAVLSHEQAHVHYRDTFWFFGLGCLRHLTAWLPNSQALWEELLLLRELRADHWATQQVDGLVLAESLLMVVSAPLLTPVQVTAPVQSPLLRDRFQERIEALLSENQPPAQLPWWVWSWLSLALLPFLVIPFHC